MTRRLIDLTHPLHDGVDTHPGLPGPRHGVFRSRRQYQQAEGMPFQIDRVDLVGNTGTYLDSPFHRFADGPDLAALPLHAVADLPAVLVDARQRADRSVDVALLEQRTAGLEFAGTAVLLHAGGDTGWTTPAYAEQAPYLTRQAARWLPDRAPALVGIDAVNIDDLHDQTRAAARRAAALAGHRHLAGTRVRPHRGPAEPDGADQTGRADR